MRRPYVVIQGPLPAGCQNCRKSYGDGWYDFVHLFSQTYTYGTDQHPMAEYSGRCNCARGKALNQLDRDNGEDGK